MKEEMYIQLAPGLKISRVLTGLWQIADLERDGNTLDPIETAKYMKPYAKAGLCTFDMADHYGSAEVIAGAFKNQVQGGDKVQLLTKWVPEPGKVSKETVRKAIERALSRLQSSQLDLLQYHAWSYPDPAWLDTLFELQELKKQGLIKHLGVTNFDAAHLRIALASGIQLVSNQVCYSLLDQRASGEMKNVCEQYGVKLLAFGTLAGGFLSDKWLNKPEPKVNESFTWSQMKYKRFIDEAGSWSDFQNLLQTLKPIANKHKISIANIATKFILSQSHVAGVIVGARLGQSEHIGDTVKLFNSHFDEEDFKVIQEQLAGLNHIHGDCGDEYRKPPFLTASGDLSHHLKGFPAPYEIKTAKNGNQLVVSGTYWEDMAGYSRAIKLGNTIKVSGTTATHGNLLIGGKDLKAQTHFIIDKIEGAILSLGGTLEDVSRTRIFVNDVNDWEPVARAHGERFKDIQPANTLVGAKLVGEGYKVEIEAEATLK
ncbi:aldo/keto reductase [Croceitalea rosinachiae]|uniref:Aldo/keto reductase n=1 Tax=Croceitalea rosinachiae TaxID=3075596 RepID=A0ABU3AFH2_9FLAO|nr:aldo/keto reductase [Croceitalea sp. F388]MDT0607606.1 aldo/keto reductase [Croceitalea sp. F388]